MTPSLLGRFRAHASTHGLPAAIHRASASLERRWSACCGTGRAVEKRRRELSSAIAEHVDSTVRYGPFRGLRLSDHSSWDASARAAMLLGLYEQEILHELQDVPDRCRTFIDVGAADGYYAVGVLVNGRFSKTYCFEMSSRGRDAIGRNSRLNNVLGRVNIHGEAGPTFYTTIPAAERENAVVLIDVEGGEFELLDSAALQSLSRSVIFVEIHEWVTDAETKARALRERAAATHHLRILTTGARDLSTIDELRGYTDTDRWLVCSEGRPHLMHWYRLDPRD